MLKETITNALSLSELVSEDIVYSIQAEPPETRAYLKTLYFTRLCELNADKDVKNQVNRMFRDFDKADKDIEKTVTKETAIESTDIPLIFDGNGKPLPTIDNFLLILRNDEKFKTLRFNLLSHSPEHIVNGNLERWQDVDDSKTRSYIEQKYKIHNREKLDDALNIVFAENGYHPIKQIIDAVAWDGVPRMETLFIKWLKCEDTPYTREVTRLVFAGGIHRLYNPGCKFDDVAVLVGTSQGEGKSTFIRWLALRDDFFAEVTEIEGQKGAEAVDGAWICEIAELLAVTKSKEEEAVKAYISKQVDRYRRPYERRTTEIKRQCIFIGSTNKAQFLTDKTGNRRWYPLTVASLGRDLYSHREEICADILCAWAEAKALYDKGMLPPCAKSDMLSDIKQKQFEAVQEDYRVGLIMAYCEKHEKVCILELWKEALGEHLNRPTRKDSNEITLILQGLEGWSRGRPERHPEYGVQRFWYKSPEQIRKEKLTALPDVVINIPS